MFVKTETRPESSAPCDPSGNAWLSIIPAWQWLSDGQLYRDGRAVGLPLRWSKLCQQQSMVPGIGHTQPLAEAITLHSGLEG